MLIDQLREYCLSKPDAEEGLYFGEDSLVLKSEVKYFNSAEWMIRRCSAALNTILPKNIIFANTIANLILYLRI